MTKILFIMFPGIGVTKEGWDHQYINGKKVKHNFISELKKLGKIYFYEPKYYNLYYYYGGKYANDYDKDINFTKDDLDVDKICGKIYEDVKDFKGKLVLVGHSMGSYFVYYFSQKYATKCLFGVIIDGMLFNSPTGDYYNNKKKFNEAINKYIKYTDNDINKLRIKVYNGDKKSIKELSEVYFNNIASYNKIIKNYKKFKTPIISFCNFQIPIEKTPKKFIDEFNYFNKERINENIYIRKYNDPYNFTIIDFINKTHFPHDIKESREIILDNIKQRLP